MRESHYRRRIPRDLTERQRQVLDYIARGKTNAEIAAALGITLDGAKAHVSTLLAKLEVASREEAATLWRSRGASARLQDLLARAAVPGLALKLGLGAAAAAAAVVAVGVLMPARSERGLVEPPDRPPPFHATYTVGATLYEGWYRDQETWRVEFVSEDADPPASGRDSALLSGGQLSMYHAAENTYAVLPASEGLGDDPSRWLRWDHYWWPLPDGGALPTREYLSQRCTAVGNEPVAGRHARRLACGDSPASFDVWVDVAEGWLLKWVRHQATTSESRQPTPGDTGRRDSFEVLAIQFGPKFPVDVFRFTPPPGSLRQEDANRDPARHSRLKLGEVAPGWSARQPDGTQVSTKDVGTPAIYVFVASWCDKACDVLGPFAASATRWKGKVHFVVVAMGEQTAAPALPLPAGPQDYTFLVASDSTAWKVASVPYWVAIDANGAVQELGLSGFFAGQEDRIASGLTR